MSNGLLNNLEEYWDVDEATGNLLGKIIPQTLSGKADVPTRVTGKLNNGADFLSDNVICEGYHANLDFRQNPMVDFTVSFWFKLNSVKTTGATWLVEAYDDAGVSEGGWAIAFRGQNSPDDCAIFYRVDAVTTEVLSITSGNLSAGVWYHLVAGYDATNSKLFAFFNGVREEVAVTGQIMTSGNVAFTVGGWGENGAEPANAVIDEIGAWSTVLTQAQVNSLYNGGSALSYSSFDSGTGASSEEDAPNHDNANDGPLFSRAMEVTNHLQANPIDTGDAAITVMYRQVPL